jgi:hypothetical protein
MASRLSREFFFIFILSRFCMRSKQDQAAIRQSIHQSNTWPHGDLGNFFIFILSRFCKKYMVRQSFLQKYTSGALTHGVRDITLWAATLGAARSGPWACPRPSAVACGVRVLTPWAMASGPSAVAHGVSIPLASWPTALGFACLYNTGIQPKMS